MKILLADDDDALRRVLEFQLREAGYDVESAPNGAAALDAFSAGDFGCVITDWRMPQMSGREFVERVVALRSETPVIVITAFGDVETAVAAMRSGAFDFITKPFDRQSILLTVEKALRFGSILAENRRLRRLVHDDFRIANLVGTSEKMQAVTETAGRVAQTDVTVLVEGESGTGKELIARGIHFSGKRREGPFIAVNCAAIPENLIEAELFGYRKGAFTGADRDAKGKFEEASGGTLFLDEIGAMPIALQARLLRVLQEREIVRLGESSPRAVDVRIVAATNRDLSKMAAAGEFREDLFYRLAVVPIRLPALRERREDIPLLTEHFLRRAAERHGLAPPKPDREAYAALISYSWPGNVRELENTIERAVVLGSGETVSVADLPDSVRSAGASAESGLWFELPESPFDLEALEHEILRAALRKFGGNQSAAARYLGITRSALIYRMQKAETENAAE